jgi:hypothetical protein
MWVARRIISSLLVPTVTSIIDDGLAVGLCTSLVNGATGMAGTTVYMQQPAATVTVTNVLVVGQQNYGDSRFTQIWGTRTK